MAVSTRSASTPVVVPGRRTWGGARSRETRRVLLALLFLSPSLIVFALFVFVPLLRSMQLSVHATNPIGQMRDFVGLDHYRRMFAQAEFFNSMRVSVTFAFYAVSVTVLGALGLALLGNIRIRGITVFRAIYSSTIAVSGATASLIFLFHPAIGVLNYMLDLAGLPRVNWLISTETALISVSWVTIWLSLGLNTIIMLAGMRGDP